MYKICPLFPLFPLFPLSTYLEPSTCVRTRPPLLPDARKLTPSLFPSSTLLPSPTQNPDPLGLSRSKYTSIRKTLWLLQKIRNKLYRWIIFVHLFLLVEILQKNPDSVNFRQPRSWIPVYSPPGEKLRSFDKHSIWMIFWRWVWLLGNVPTSQQTDWYRLERIAGVEISLNWADEIGNCLEKFKWSLMNWKPSLFNEQTDRVQRFFGFGFIIIYSQFGPDFEPKMMLIFFGFERYSNFSVNPWCRLHRGQKKISAYPKNNVVIQKIVEPALHVICGFRDNVPLKEAEIMQSFKSESVL